MKGMGGMMAGGGLGMRSWLRGSIDDNEIRGAVYDHKVVLRLLKYLRPHTLRMVVTFTAMLVYSGTVVLLPLIIKWIIDDFIATEDLAGLNLAVMVFVLVAFLQFLAQYIHMRLMNFVGQRVLYKLRVNLFNHMQRLSMRFFDRNEVGRLMSRVQNDVQQLQEIMSGSGIMQAFVDMLSLFGIVAVMLAMNVHLAIITLAVVPLLFFLLAFWQKYARQSFVEVRQSIAEVNSKLQENISGVRVVQSLNREQSSIESFGQANYYNLNANLQAGKYTAILLPSVEMLMAIGLSLAVFFGGSMVLQESLEWGVLVAFALYIQRFFEPVRRLTMEYGTLQRAMASGARVFEILDEKIDVRDKPGATALPLLEGLIRYESVDFQYIPDLPVLQGIDFQVLAGETVALVGPTGTGKTTLVSLLMRLYDVTEGRITLDGHDIRDVSRDSLTRQMSVVLQEPFLFSDTVSENIRFNSVEVSDADIVKAATAVGAHEFISKLQDGYDTQIRERGVNLSIGQRQLISFARALVSDPQVLILDEATANIDTHSEELIRKALGELLQGRTALVIAHRLSTVRNADRIVVLEGGRIVEQGTHEQLLELDGMYARLDSYTGKMES